MTAGGVIARRAKPDEAIALTPHSVIARNGAKRSDEAIAVMVFCLLWKVVSKRTLFPFEKKECSPAFKKCYLRTTFYKPILKVFFVFKLNC